MHALVIEDHAFIAWLIEEELRDLGYDSVAIASTEQEAVESARNNHPQLITVDGHLQSGDGISAIQSICRGGVVPTIFITGDPEAIHRFAPDAIVLEKPFTPAQFLRAVEMASVHK